MSSTSFKFVLTVALVMVMCLVQLTACKSINDKEFDMDTFDEAIESKLARIDKSNKGQMNSKRLSDDEFDMEPLDEAESKPSRADDTNQGQRLSGRVQESNENQNILNKCYSGGLEETVKALGVLDLPGVRLIKVEGELYQKLLKNKTLVEMKPKSNDSAPNAFREKSAAKRSSSIDICEEEFAYTYVLAHASGQLAYQVDTVVCQGSLCQSPWLNSIVGDFGDCVLKEQRMIVYLIDPYGNFVPQTIDIGCACECMAYS